MPNTYIVLPFSQGEQNRENNTNGFWSDALKRHLEMLPDQGFPIGARQCNFDEVPHQESLDYWLRQRYVRYPDIMQAVDSVQTDLVETNDFEIRVVENGRPGRNPRWIFLSN